MSDLSQDEIDALIAGAMEKEDDSEGPVEQTAESEEHPEKAGKKANKIKRYDFTNPNPIPEEQKKTITYLHESMAQKLRVTLSAFLRSEVDIALQSVEQLTFAQYTASLSSPTCVMSFDMPPLSGYGIIEVNAVIAYSVINRMLGGDGSVPAQVRPFTDVELAILRRLIDCLLGEMCKTWKSIINLNISPKEMYTNPSLVHTIPMKEVCVIITMNAKIADASALITFCIPYSNLEPIAFKLGNKQWGKMSSKQSEDIQSAHRRNFLALELELKAILSKFKMSMSDILSLEKGDILDTGQKTRNPIVLRVGNQDKYEVNPGLLHKYKAVSIQRELIKE